MIEGVENLVPNVCTVAGFEVATYGRFWGGHRGAAKQNPPFGIVSIDVEWTTPDHLLITPDILW